jgi:hypothetical protein
VAYPICTSGIAEERVEPVDVLDVERWREWIRYCLRVWVASNGRLRGRLLCGRRISSRREFSLRGSWLFPSRLMIDFGSVRRDTITFLLRFSRALQKTRLVHHDRDDLISLLAIYRNVLQMCKASKKSFLVNECLPWSCDETN